MARYKPYDYRQTKMLPVRFDEQILPGTFEYTLNRLIDESIDLSVFEARYRNDDGGVPAYDPAVLLLRKLGRRFSTSTLELSLIRSTQTMRIGLCSSD
jgi:hypothetical protein